MKSKYSIRRVARRLVLRGMGTGIAAAVAVATPSSVQEAVARPAQVAAVSDTVPLLGVPISTPSPEARGFAAVPVIEIAPPPESPQAATYAKRYRISRELAQKIIDSARAEGVDPELAFRLVRVESVFRTGARGPSGALGLTQLMPSTARAVDRSIRTEAQILDPDTNLRTGFRYLRRMIERYRGDVRLGLLAYNRGQTTVDRALKAGRDPENGYSSKVLGRAGDRYAGKGLLQ